MKSRSAHRLNFCCRFFAPSLLLTISALSCSNGRAQTPTTIRQFDFGTATALMAPYTVADVQEFSATRGFGWLQAQGLLLRDRRTPDALRRDFVWGKEQATFRITGLTPERYKLTVISGDALYGDHKTRVQIEGAEPMPLLEPAANEYATLTAAINCGETCDIRFDSPNNNWAVSAISLEPTTEVQAPTVTKQLLIAPVIWDLPKTDPTGPLLSEFQAAGPVRDWKATNTARADYLKLIEPQIDFWRTKQDANGAIIDPYRKEEFQYSTPAYAHAAATLVKWRNRKDLLESAALAMDWATLRLSQRKAATGHEDFYPPMLAHTYRLLEPLVKAERAAAWKTNLAGINPYKIYRVTPGGSNWNVVSLSGEALFQHLGIRPKTSDYVEKSLGAQSIHFGSDYGLYLEGPMAYDHFPRLWLADMLEIYQGPYSAQVKEHIRRAAITSLFMQSPHGELPSGGRSAQHQWNEAEQCVTYEIFAAQAARTGQNELAGIYKRAAHLALQSMRHWVRPSGEMQIIKNWVDPAQGHAYEGYSAHSQYNLLAMSMLAIAYEHAESTETIAERPAPADKGGFVLSLPELHKVFANAGGTYVELDTTADHHYDATGLIRVHMPNIPAAWGPSDSLVAEPTYRRPVNSPKTTTGVGISWQDKTGQWRRLGELGAEQIKSVQVKKLAATPQRVAFDVIYEGELFGVQQIVEHYVLQPGRVELTTEIKDYTGPLRYVWPVLADDGRTQSTIEVKNGRVSVGQKGKGLAQTFVPRDAGSVRVEDEKYANHNGWARLGVAEYPRGGSVTLIIEPVE